MGFGSDWALVSKVEAQEIMVVPKWQNSESQCEIVKNSKVLGVVMINLKQVHCPAQSVCQMGRDCMVKYSMVGGN